VHRSSAAFGSAIFFAVAPGVVSGLVPWLLTGWQPGTYGALPTMSFALMSFALALRILGAVLVVAGAAVLLHAFARFVREGLGTPAPVAPTQRLVVGGLYRYVRNPMYVAVIATIVGQALLLGRMVLLWYALLATAAMVSFVRWYEEPTLRRQFGEAYDEYRATVPGWRPKLSALKLSALKLSVLRLSALRVRANRRSGKDG
jgi:protein-S-isoprenylcysteine O-methyltransferase Ste14